MNTPSELAAKDIAAHLHPFTNLATHADVGPLVITRGDGILVEDEQGRRYIEGMSGLWCSSLGFSHPRLIAAGTQALQTLPSTTTPSTTAPTRRWRTWPRSCWPWHRRP